MGERENDDFHLEIGRRLSELDAPRRRRQRRKEILFCLVGAAIFLGLFGLCLGVGRPVVEFVHEVFEDVFPAKKIDPPNDK